MPPNKPFNNLKLTFSYILILIKFRDVLNILSAIETINLPLLEISFKKLSVVQQCAVIPLIRLLQQKQFLNLVTCFCRKSTEETVCLHKDFVSTALMINKDVLNDKLKRIFVENEDDTNNDEYFTLNRNLALKIRLNFFDKIHTPLGNISSLSEVISFLKCLIYTNCLLQKR